MDINTDFYYRDIPIIRCLFNLLVAQKFTSLHLVDIARRFEKCKRAKTQPDWCSNAVV